jgi:RNA 3'-terminal phosphate cyclase (ATP)
MKTKMDVMLELDGAQGEGGGQILRSALALSMLRGRAFRLANIRAGRSKPGLMRQHLTCVRAAAEICHAQVDGAQIGSTELVFRPGSIRGGDYEFKVGSAGSTMLVLQTVLPALLRAPQPSRLRIEGGTHALAAPSTDFIEQAFLPLLARMGGRVALQVECHGFFPAGGGQVSVQVQPSILAPLQLLERGAALGMEAVAITRSLPLHIAERELEVAERRLPLTHRAPRPLSAGFGAGNALVLTARYAQVSEVVVGLGEQGVSAENVAGRACDEMRSYMAHGAPVGEHLADQLLLPLLLAGGGEFVTGRPSSHLETNAAVIAAFDAAEVRIAPDESDPQRRYRVTLQL